MTKRGRKNKIKKVTIEKEKNMDKEKEKGKNEAEDEEKRRKLQKECTKCCIGECEMEFECMRELEEHIERMHGDKCGRRPDSIL